MGPRLAIWANGGSISLVYLTSTGFAHLVIPIEKP